MKSTAYQTALIGSLEKMNSTIELMISAMNKSGGDGILPPPQRPFEVIRMDDYGITIQKF